MWAVAVNSGALWAPFWVSGSYMGILLHVYLLMLQHTVFPYGLTRVPPGPTHTGGQVR